MKKFICVGEPYELNGEKKMRWNRLGEIFTAKSGKDYAKLYFMPGQLLSIFDDEKKEQKPAHNELEPDQEVNF